MELPQMVITKVAAIVPTLNEEGTISQLITCLRGLEPPIDVVVVDDSSTDQTVALIESAASSDDGVKLIRREGRPDFGQSYIEGYRYALASGYEAVVCMDADLSHNPDDIPRLLAALGDADLVIGSRYVNGTVNVVNWPASRLMLSLFSSAYVRFITRLPLTDPMAGFKAIRREALERLDFDKIKSRGFAFQTDVVYRIFKYGMRIAEVPVVFTEREAGNSKMSIRRILEEVFMPFRLRFTVRGKK